MNNPLRILHAVDARLDQPIEFFLFGRAALIGFDDPPTEAAATQAVDGLIPRDHLATLRANDQWWAGLEAEGLYLTHLFVLSCQFPSRGMRASSDFSPDCVLPDFQRNFQRSVPVG